MSYLISRNNQQLGPYTLPQLQQFVAEGRIAATDLAWSEGMPNWVPVAQVLGNMPSSPPPAPPQGGFYQTANPYAAPSGQIIHPTGSAMPLTWKQILFSFDGRIPRRQYWGASLIMLGIVVVFAILFALLMPAVFSSHSGVSDIGGGLLAVLSILIIPLGVLFIWMSLAVQVKRWHDRDKAWPWIFIGFIPYLGAIWNFVEQGCLRGTVGPNRFGEDPT